MATNGVSPFNACVDLYKDPVNLFLALSCISTIAGKTFTICGKDCSQFADLAKIGTVFGDFFGFWDSGKVIQSAYDGLRDVKTIMWDHHYQEITLEEIREGKIDPRTREKDPKTIINENITTNPDISPNRWMAERVGVAALKTFTSVVLAYEVLNKLGAIKSGPSANLKALGCAAGVITCAYNVLEEERKIADGPIEGKVKNVTDQARYNELYEKNHKDEQYKKVTFIFIKLVGVIAALGPVYGKDNLLGKVSAWSGDLLTFGFTTFGVLSLKQQLQSGAEMQQIEAKKAI